MKNNEIILSVKDLSFRYGKKKEPVFSGLSLSVRKGETVLLMGPSGCGKSSLAYCLAGLYPAYAGVMEGEISYEGKPLSEYSISERSRMVSILFQNPDNQFCMDKVENEILFALENINYQGDLNAKVDELLDFVGLMDERGKMIHTLSGGTKQKLALATSLATGARVLVLDEPFANLDPAACIQIAEKLKALNKMGLTLLVVDHRMDYWKSFMSRVLIMEKEGDPVSISGADAGSRIEEFEKRGLFSDDMWLKSHRPKAIPENGEMMASARNLSLFHGKKLFLDGIDFELPKGSITAIIGRNGSGKTTLMNAIAGVTKTAGDLKVGGRVGLVFQNPRFQFLTLTVGEEVEQTLKVIYPKAGKNEIAEKVDRLLSEFEMLSYKKVSPYALSQGQQRRLAILSMLAGDRPLLLLDEPTYAQDEKSTRFIMELLEKRVDEGLTAVFATHDLELCRAFANQVYLMEDCRLTKLTDEEFESYASERRV